MKQGWLVAAALSLMFVSAGVPMWAQDGPGGGMRGQFAGMQRVNGEVVSVDGGKLTLKAEDGSVSTVVTTDNTRVMKSSGQMPGAGGGGMRGEGGARAGGGGPAMNMTPIKIADVKVGDGVMAAGQLDTPAKTLHAVFVVTTDASVVKAMKENLGKTYIAGKVTVIDLDNAKITVARPDGVTQIVQLDENTSFRRGRGPRGGAGGTDAPSAESITLADVKVGDQVAGQGAVKAGFFVPAQLTVSTPRPRPADAAK